MTRYQLVGIGNAIVDVLSHSEDTFLDLMGIEKGIMQLVERDRAEVLYAAMRERTEAPGGSGRRLVIPPNYPRRPPRSIRDGCRARRR